MIRTTVHAAGLTLLLLAFSTGPTFGHHSATMFDQEREVTLQGVIRRVDWVNPHVYIHVEGTTPGGADTVWAVEAGPPNVMSRNGWSRETVTAGERVVVTASPPRNPRGTTVLGKTLVREDGVVLDVEASSNPTRLQGSETSDQVASEDLNGTWLTEWDFAAASRFLQPTASWEVTAAGREAVSSYNGQVNPGKDCVQQTVPFVMIWPALHRIQIGDDVTLIRSEWGERTIDMTRESHDGAPFSNQGHSIGRWDGATLVVDTARFSDHRSGLGGGLPSGSGKHLVERLTLSPERTRIVYTYEVEDPEYLAEPMTGSLQLVHRPDLSLISIPCDPEAAARYLEEQ